VFAKNILFGYARHRPRRDGFHNALDGLRMVPLALLGDRLLGGLFIAPRTLRTTEPVEFSHHRVFSDPAKLHSAL